MNLTIVGLTRVGMSIGLALKAVSEDIAIIGHDPDPERTKSAKALGAIDKSHWNLISACEKADLILLDLPLEEVEKTLAALRDEVQAGVVILDMSSTKRPVLDLAERILPETVQLIGGNVVSLQLSAHGGPSAGTLNRAIFYLVAPENATKQALAMVSNLAEAVGAQPHYIDAAEHDGLMAATAQLPFLSALALVGALSKEAGWPDRARSAGAEFATAESLLLDIKATSVEALLSNKDNLLHWVDLYTQELGALRRFLQEGEGEGLQAALEQAVETCAARRSGEASRDALAEEPVSSWQSLFFGSLGRRKKGS